MGTSSSHWAGCMLPCVWPNRGRYMQSYVIIITNQIWQGYSWPWVCMEWKSRAVSPSWFKRKYKNTRLLAVRVCWFWMLWKDFTNTRFCICLVFSRCCSFTASVIMFLICRRETRIAVATNEGDTHRLFDQCKDALIFRFWMPRLFVNAPCITICKLKPCTVKFVNKNILER